MPPPAESFLDGYLPYLLRRADQHLSSRFYTVLDKAGIARSEWRVLAVLNERQALSVAELTIEALSPQPTVTHALSRLEKRGLILRAPGTDDKRKRFVSITAEGSTLTQSLITQAKQLEQEALANAGDLNGLIAQLQAVAALVDENNALADSASEHA